MKNEKLAFVFPGQGSQSVGMLSELAETFPQIKETFDRASHVLEKDLWQMVIEGPKEELNLTQNTQPVMLTAGYAIWEIWRASSVVLPTWMSGHSLGEYTALVCSGALSFEDAVALVAERGRLMQEAVPGGQGAMAAILGLGDETVIAICEQQAENDVVSAVNFNAPGQVVVAGDTVAVERVILAAKDAGAKRAVKLPVSVPSHCELMHPAAEKLEHYFKDVAINIPEIRLLHNVDVQTHNTVADIKAAIKTQLFKPVRWVETISKMQSQGVTHFVECGPGKVLAGLNKRVAKGASHLSIYDVGTLNNALEVIG